MRPLVSKLKPARGYSEIFHTGLLVLLPLILFAVRQLGTVFVPVALVLIVLSKWRIFAVRPRFWATLIRANSVDLTVGVATVVFLQHSGGLVLQLFLALLYAGWLLYVKPASNTFAVAMQAGIAQLVGLMALFLALPNAASIWLVSLGAIICSISARHFFDGFDEPYSKMLSYLWGYFAGGLLWVLSHWLLFYAQVSQPVVLLSAIGYGLAGLYYLDHAGKLNVALRRQFVFIMLAVIIVIITFSDWGDKVV